MESERASEHRLPVGEKTALKKGQAEGIGYQGGPGRGMQGQSCLPASDDATEHAFNTSAPQRPVLKKRQDPNEETGFHAGAGVYLFTIFRLDCFSAVWFVTTQSSIF